MRHPDSAHGELPDRPEGTPLDPQRTFVHMSYAYGYAMAARIAMQGDLATLGRDKVGFSVVERRADGEPVCIGGVRGVGERNAMRHLLAIEAHLRALDLPPSEQVGRHLRDWCEATERYPTLRSGTPHPLAQVEALP